MSEEKDLLILQKNTLEKQKELRYNELMGRGIPDMEATRAVEAEFIDYPTPVAEPWPGPVTGIDLAGNINLDIVPDTGYPPVIQPNTDKTEPFPTPNQSPYGIGTTEQPYPSSPTPDPYPPLGSSASNTYNITHFPAENSNNWSATASQVNSEPSMHGEHGFNVEKSIPEWRYPIEDSQVDFGINIPPIAIEPSGQYNEVTGDTKKVKKSLMQKLAPYLALVGSSFTLSKMVTDYMDDAPEEPEDRDHYFTHTPMKLMAEFTLSSRHKIRDVCDDYAGKSFNLLELERPILPTEGKGYTNLVHPHCQCFWKLNKLNTPEATLTRKQKTNFDDIAAHIEKAAKDHTLHTVKPDGELSKRTRGTNPMKESIGKIRHESAWLTDEYLGRAKEAALRNGGQLYLIRAATETITDHRSEGEVYRRKLSGKELHGMARTAIGRNMDINHDKKYATGGEILDSEFDSKRKEIQMLVMETDPEIIKSIEKGDITAVSINGGNPRRQTIEPCYDGCTGPECELCNAPEGVILGELDGIGMTWVVTAPNGIMWRGQHITNATPGIKNTVLEIL